MPALVAGGSGRASEPHPQIRGSGRACTSASQAS